MSLSDEASGKGFPTLRQLLSQEFPESSEFDAFLRWGFPAVWHAQHDAMDRTEIINLLLSKYSTGDILVTLQRYRDSAPIPEAAAQARPAARVAADPNAGPQD